MKSKNENIMQFNTQANARVGKISVDSSDSEDNEDQSENENAKKTVFVDWGKPSSNSTTKKRPVISFNDLENKTKEEKEKVKEKPVATEESYQPQIQRVSSANTFHYPQHQTEYYMNDNNDDYPYSNHQYQRGQYNNYGGSHKNYSSKRNQFYDNTEDTVPDNRNYRNENDSYQQPKFVLGQRQQVSQPPPPQQQQQQQQQPQPQPFYRTQPPVRSQPNISNHHSRDMPQFKFGTRREQPDPTAQRQQPQRPNPPQRTMNFNFNQQKQPEPNVMKFRPSE
ncbi:hypothetical protein M9Y10_009327 [Tritrichomonas musculus]|uniref:Uncharacterized protein n=1 Tax=Tritrichomonas musculus TaxID=1915356 RepID=A0ABR2IN69_9EUKA